MDILICTVGKQRYGIALQDIERVIQAVAIAPIPHSAPYIAGAIDLHGTLLPVIDANTLLQSDAEPLRDSDCFILCRIQNKRMALWVQKVDKVQSQLHAKRVPVPMAEHNATSFAKTDSQWAPRQAIPQGICSDNGIFFLLDLSKLLPEDFFEEERHESART